MPSSVLGALGTGSCQHRLHRKQLWFILGQGSKGDTWWREVCCSHSEGRMRAEPESAQTHGQRRCPGHGHSRRGLEAVVATRQKCLWGGAHRGLSAGPGQAWEHGAPSQPPGQAGASTRCRLREHSGPPAGDRRVKAIAGCACTSAPYVCRWPARCPDRRADREHAGARELADSHSQTRSQLSTGFRINTAQQIVAFMSIYSRGTL